MFKNPPITYIVLHHSAVSRMSGKKQFDAVNTYHKNKNWGTTAKPWYQSATSELGYYVTYNYFIDVDGSVTQTRAIGEETIAQVGHNCDVLQRCDAVSICVAGDFSKELLSDEEINSVRKLLLSLKEKYPEASIVFHRDLQKGRTCAGSLFTQDYLNTRILGNSVVKLDKIDTEKQQEINDLMEQITTLQRLVAYLKTKLFK